MARSSRRPVLWLIASGSVLVLLGLFLAVWLPRSPSASSAPQAGRPLVVPARVDYAAPDLQLTDLEGRPVSLADYRGQVVLLNNWATWCPPCKAEMPTLQAYYEAHQGQGFVLIAVEAGEPADEVRAFVQQYGLTFPVWLDPQNLSLTRFRTDALPSSFVIDRSGRVRLAWTGAIERSTLEEYVTPLLEE